MSVPLLVEMFDRLPELKPGDDEELWAAGVQDAMREFRAAVRERYTEGTLARLLSSTDARTRRAAVLALGLIGTIEVNPAVAAVLHDEDPLVQRFASDALWELWFRGGTAEQNRLLERAAREPRPVTGPRRPRRPHPPGPELRRGVQPARHLVLQAGRVRPGGRRLRDHPAAEPLSLRRRGRARAVLPEARQAARGAAAPSAHALEINPGLDHLHDTIRSLEEALDRGGE